MKILILNGSPRADGNTAFAINTMKEVFATYEGVEVEVVQVGNQPVKGCLGCGACYKLGRCVQDDIVNEIAAKFEQADALVLASPVHYASPDGMLIALCDRLFYSTNFDCTMKVGAALAVARRGGTTAALDVLNKYFGIVGMPIAPSCYWNNIHGAKPGEAAQDEEGVRIMKTLADNIVFLCRSIALGKERYGLPEKQPKARTNFIR